MAEPRIRILPPEIAERIAAGEVVERPASVVKELVENALDAGARRITVETEAGGKAQIRISDDGCGMTAEEVGLAIHRHATSKLRSAEDLFDIRTLGFRGEAMPSIAAVSEMEVLTRTPEAAEGSRVVIHGGTVVEEQAAAANIGTQITVRRLFFNVPVREKFLRSDVAEAGHITEWLQRLALVRSDVSFRLAHDGREALLSPGSQDPLNAVVALLGRAVAREMIRLPGPGIQAFRHSGVQEQGSGFGVQDDYEDKERGRKDEDPSKPAIEVTGFLGRPTLSRANRALQHTYVNGRAVRSQILYRALDDAFRSTMPHRRHPVAVLFVHVPPGEVDVNVHPAKTEVRFVDEAAIHQAVLGALQAALRSEAVQPALPEGTGEINHGDPESVSGAGTEARRAHGEGVERSYEVSRTSGYPLGEPSQPAYAPTPFADSALGGGSPGVQAFTRSGVQEARPGEAVPPSSFIPHPSSFLPPHAQSPTPRAQPAIPSLTYLGQTQDLFLIAEGGGRLWIIDQHVAHERVLFDRLTASSELDAPEALLIPVTVELDQPRSLALDENREALGELGFAIEPFGAGRYLLRSVPRSLLGRNYEAALRDMADELSELSRGGQVRLRREEVAMAAAGRSCKSAVKAGQKLSTREIEQLLSDLREARNPHTCPHGRPVFLTYEPADLDRLFGPRPCRSAPG